MAQGVIKDSSGGNLQSSRAVAMFSNSGAAQTLPTGTLIADASLDHYDASGNVLQCKSVPNDAASANADAWFAGNAIT